MSRLSWLLTILVVIGLGAGGYWWYYYRPQTNKITPELNTPTVTPTPTAVDDSNQTASCKRNFARASVRPLQT